MTGWAIQLAIGLLLGAALIVIFRNYKSIHLTAWPDVKPIITFLVACAALIVGARPETGAQVRTTFIGAVARRSKLAWIAIALDLFGIVDALGD